MRGVFFQHTNTDRGMCVIDHSCNGAGYKGRTTSHATGYCLSILLSQLLRPGMIAYHRRE